MKSICRTALAGLLVMGMAVVVFNSQADERSAEGAAFQGRVSSVDKSAQTVTINGQTYQVLPTSRITKDQQSATINDLAVGDQVAGNYKKSAENKLEVLSMDFTKGSTAQAGAGTYVPGGGGKVAFTGRVTRVDPATQTVTIGRQTFQVLPTSQITMNGRAVRFNNIRVGQHLSGHYKLSDANKMEVLAMEIGGRGAIGGTDDRATSEAGATFSGRIVKVDRAAQTVTVGQRTFQILPTTIISTAGGNPITLADVRAEQPVSGTYKKSTNGRLELLTLEVGRSARR